MPSWKKVITSGSDANLKSLYVSGSVTVDGTLTARVFNTQLVSSSIIYESGSTKFGDTQDDTHEFTGSILTSGSITSTNGIYGTIYANNGIVSSSSQLTSSYDLRYALSGSTGGGTGTGFPFTGSAEISGSLTVTDTITADTFIGDGSGLTGIVFDIGDAASFSQPFTDETSVTVIHALNSQYPFVQVYESGSNEQIIPLTVKVLDSSSIQVTFPEEVSGYIVIAKGGHVIQGTAENSNLLDGLAASYFLNYNNLTNKPTGLISGSSQLTSSYDERYILSGSVSAADWNTLLNRPDGIVSSSTQIVPLLPTGIISGSSQVQFLSISGRPAGLVSGSSQIDASQTTNWTTNVKTRLNAETVVSSSNQVIGILTPLNTFSSSALLRLNSLESETSSYAKTNVDNSFSGIQTFNNISVNGTASFAYIESITGSAKIIGDSTLVLNVNTPAERFGGISVVDSGSTFSTSSLLYDGLENQWIFQHTGSPKSGSSILIFGPISTEGLGTEVGLTENRIPKVVTDYGHHLNDSNITDSGTLITLGSNTVVTGTIVASDTTLVSGSSQVQFLSISGIPVGLVSGSSQVSYTGLSSIPGGIVSGSTQITPLLPTGTISGSSQVNADTITNFDPNVLTYINSLSVVSGSVSSNFNSLTNNPFTSSTAITASNSIVPSTGSTLNLGSDTRRWNIVYTSDLSLKNDRGDWTIVEGEDDLFLYNNKRGKVYKFNLTEVNPTEAPPKKE